MAGHSLERRTPFLQLRNDLRPGLARERSVRSLGQQCVKPSPNGMQFQSYEHRST